MGTKYSIGLDLGTNSVRALIVDAATGEEIAESVWDYVRGEGGVVLDPRDPHLARQDPADWVQGVEACVRQALQEAASHDGFSPQDVIGMGVDTTGSTPLPVDRAGEPLAFHDEFRGNPNALAWLWKDHTGHAEAEEITEAASRRRPHYLAKCGGKYSSEWLWSKALHCLRVAPELFDAAHTWVEMADWIPALLTGTTHADALKRCVCAAGHKAMFNPAWGGYPDEEFVGSLDDRLAGLRRTLPDRAYSIADTAGTLTPEWAQKLGLPAGIPVAMGAIDAHLGGVGSGIGPGMLVKIMGTSTCDMMVWPLDEDLPDIPGLCGIVPESILPGYYGLEAGQSAVGDIYNWFVNTMRPGGAVEGSHEALTEQAAQLRPGQSGLLGLDWHNGNRTVLADQRLTGVLVGMTLHTTPAEIYRSLIESTAFGARVIMGRFEEYGLTVGRVVNCGGISVKNPLVMQVHADIVGRTMEVTRSAQACALGAAMAGAVVAGSAAGGYDNFDQAIDAMTGVLERKYVPDPDSAKVYERLYGLYKRLHDIYGAKDRTDNLYDLMKEVQTIRDEARG
ncbi:MAG: ribulokinase [Candidatus Brocadiae bacterium]|nr:ribulokinase [Candidatus Brocadiia bacterium]